MTRSKEGGTSQVVPLVRSIKRRPAEVVDYEINMLRYCFARLVPTLPASIEEINAMLEAYLVHYRALIEFFAGQSAYPSDLSVAKPTAWASRVLRPDEIARVVKLAKPLRRKWFTRISQQLSHCTKPRYEQQIDWPIEDEMHPQLERVIQEYRALNAT
jgi:hypothetical protein